MSFTSITFAGFFLATLATYWLARGIALLLSLSLPKAMVLQR